MYKLLYVRYNNLVEEKVPKKLGRSMTVREVHETWQRRLRGETVSSLARELGCTTSNLRLRWKKVGIDIKAHGYGLHPTRRSSPVGCTRIWSMRQRGMAYAEIARELGESEPDSFKTLNRLQMRLRRFCKKNGIKLPEVA